jgi:hypothetical protein
MTEVLTQRTLAGLPVRTVHERSPFLNIMIYGASGTGKTILTGSADAVPEMRPVLFVDIEGGTESLRATYPDVETVRVTTWKEMQAVYNVLHSGKHDYRTVVLDSLTEIQKFNMYNIMTELYAAKGDSGKVDPDVPSMREWGKNLEQIRRFVRAFRDLQMHTLFTALERQDKDERTGLVTIRPSLSGKMAEEVAAFLDIVMYYYVKEVKENEETVTKRLLLTRKSPQHTAKDRSGKLPIVIQDPDMSKLYQLMYGQETH